MTDIYDNPYDPDGAGPPGCNQPPGGCPQDHYWDDVNCQCVPVGTGGPPPPGSTPPPDSGTGDSGNNQGDIRDFCFDPNHQHYNHPECVEWRQNPNPNDPQDCPPGQVWDWAQNMCVQSGSHDNSCPDGQYTDPVTGQCVDNPNPTGPDACPPGYTWDDASQQCQYSNNPCQDPGHPQYNSANCQGWRDQFTPGNDPAPPGPVDTPQPIEYDPSRDWMNIFDYDGVNAINPWEMMQGFDYEQFQEYEDRAYDQAMRTLGPELEEERNRFDQQLINQGIDPNSEAGQKARAQMERGQNDRINQAKFNAMGFGQQMQQQIFGQAATSSQLANQMLQHQMQLAQRGHEFDNRLDFMSNQDSWNRMMGLENLNYRDYMTYLDQQRYQNSLAMALAGLAPGPMYQGGQPFLQGGYMQDIGNQWDLWNNMWM